MAIQLLSVLMATMATILTLARLTGTMARRGLAAASSLEPAPGSGPMGAATVVCMAIAAAIMDGPVMGMDARVTDMDAPALRDDHTAAAIAAVRLEAASVVVPPVAVVSTVVVAAASTVVADRMAAAATVVVDTGKLAVC